MYSVTTQQKPQQKQQYYPQPFNRDLTMSFLSNKSPQTMSMVNVHNPQYQVSHRPQYTNIRDATRQYQPQTDDKPKMIWGRYTWILLHTMAEQIKEERFLQLRNEIMHIIYTICTNLPCPMCADHAKEYLSRSNLMNAQSKEELKYELFKFHNTVNLRKQYPQFTIDQLNSLYSKSIPRVTIQNFLVQFNNKSKSMKLLADELHRQNITQNLKAWFDVHIHDFNDPSTP